MKFKLEGVVKKCKIDKDGRVTVEINGDLCSSEKNIWVEESNKFAVLLDKDHKFSVVEIFTRTDIMDKKAIWFIEIPDKLKNNTAIVNALNKATEISGVEFSNEN